MIYPKQFLSIPIAVSKLQNITFTYGYMKKYFGSKLPVLGDSLKENNSPGWIRLGELLGRIAWGFAKQEY